MRKFVQNELQQIDFVQPQVGKNSCSEEQRKLLVWFIKIFQPLTIVNCICLPIAVRIREVRNKFFM